MPDAGFDAAVDPTCTEGSDTDAAPTFVGVTGAISDGSTSVILSWDPASDDDTSAETIRYRVFYTSADPFDFSTHQETARGVSELRVTGLDEGTSYRFVVRAEDSAGQRDCNVVEVEASPTAITGCIDYATWIQPIFDANCLGCHGGEESDLRRGLRLETLPGVRTGGWTGDVIVPCQPDASLLFLKVSQSQPVQGHRMPYLAPELNDAEITRIRMWIEQGAAASCPEDTSLCADTTPPTFSGVESATLVGDDLEVCWSAGSDDTSAASALRYATYYGPAAGAEDFRWTRFLSAAAEMCTTIRGVAPDQEYCFVVRARDEAGNEDANSVEQCVTVPSTACVEFAATIQPMLERECTHCHGGPAPIVDLSLDTHADILTGSTSGAIVVACDAAESLVSQKIGELPPFGLRMPADGPPHLAPMEIAALEAWIDQGTRAACSDPDPCPIP